MTDMLLLAVAGLVLVNIVTVLVVMVRQNAIAKQVEHQLAALGQYGERTERTVRDEIARNREENSTSARQLREEISQSLASLGEMVLSRMADIATLQKNQLDTFAAMQKNQLETLVASLGALTSSNEQKLEQMRQTVEAKLVSLQQDNAQKLEQMRATVDEKLHATLEQRLGQSFKIVSERLELVHKGLGEMQVLAAGVGDLKKVLTNIKTRGCWGEVQLGNLLEQMLTPEQYGTNVATKLQSNDRVEFAIRLPGRDATGQPVWLPIDAKFPQEDYQRLVDAQERGDVQAVEDASAALEIRLRSEARKIREKYVDPPNTTDFAILFLPTEGLFAEVLRRAGLHDAILQEQRVVVTGPTTLAAVLSSLQMGFRTLAIEKRSSEVWSVLGAVKTEFGKFGDVLEKVQKKLQEASNTIDTAATRSRMLERKLRGVQELPVEEAGKLLGKLDGLGGVEPSIDGQPLLLQEGEA